MKTSMEIEILCCQFSDLSSPIAHVGLELSFGCQFKCRDPSIDPFWPISLKTMKPHILNSQICSSWHPMHKSSCSWTVVGGFLDRVYWVPGHSSARIHSNQPGIWDLIDSFLRFSIPGCMFVSLLAHSQLFEHAKWAHLSYWDMPAAEHLVTSGFGVLKIVYYLRFQVFIYQS